MKKIIFIITCLSSILTATANNGLSVADVLLSQDGTGAINISLENRDYTFTAFSMKLTLPDGFRFVQNNNGTPAFEKSARFSDHSVTANIVGQTATFACLSLSNTAIEGTEGEILAVHIVSDAGTGTGGTATLSDITFSTPSEEEVIFDDVTFSLIEKEPYTSNDGLFAADVTIPQGENGTIEILLDNNDHVFTAFTFKVTLPEGFSFVLDANGNPTFEKSARFSDHSVIASVSGQTATFACLSLSSTPLSGTGGELLSVNVTSNMEQTTETEFTATLSEITFTTPSEQEILFNDTTFSIIITSGIHVGIQDIEFSETSNSPVYSIRGEYRGTTKNIHTLPKGIYIVNGKKVILNK